MRLAIWIALLLLGGGALLFFSRDTSVAGDAVAPPVGSSITSLANAPVESHDWGTLTTYAEGETYGTRDALVAMAVIKPGMEIHPPHVHAEEEYLMVTEGTGTWSLNGVERPASPGDMLYAAPWEIHGITNSGSEPMTFVVWKWNSKGVPPLAQPK